MEKRQMSDTPQYLVNYMNRDGRHFDAWTGPIKRERLEEWCAAREPHIHSASIIRQTGPRTRCLIHILRHPPRQPAQN